MEIGLKSSKNVGNMGALINFPYISKKFQKLFLVFQVCLNPITKGMETSSLPPLSLITVLFVLETCSLSFHFYHNRVYIFQKFQIFHVII